MRVFWIVLLLLPGFAAKPEFWVEGRAVGALAVASDATGRAYAWYTLVQTEGKDAPWDWVVVLGNQKEPDRFPVVPAGSRVHLLVREYRPDPYLVPPPGPPRVIVVQGKPAGEGHLPKKLGEALCFKNLAAFPDFPPPLDRIPLACKGETPPLGRPGEAVRYWIEDPFFGNGELWAWYQQDHALVTIVGSELALFGALPKNQLLPRARALALGSAPRLSLPFPEPAARPAAFRLRYPNRRYFKPHAFRLEVVPEGRRGALMRFRIMLYDLAEGTLRETRIFGSGVLGPHYAHPKLWSAFTWNELSWIWEGSAGQLGYGYRRPNLLVARYRENGGLEQLSVRGGPELLRIPEKPQRP